MRCRHRPQNFRIISLNPFKPKEVRFIDRRVQTCKKCGKRIELKHPAWFTTLIIVLLVLLYFTFRVIEIYITVNPTQRTVAAGFAWIRILVIALLLLYRFGYLLAGWKTTILRDPPPITWFVEDEKTGTTPPDVLKNNRHHFEKTNIK